LEVELNAMQLRPYQQDAVDSATAWMKKSTEPALLELATGAGKSWIAAAIAQWIVKTCKKKVLVLQPSRELVVQNASKMKESGKKASIFSASAGSKCTRYDVVYATPLTVLNSISRFGDAFGCVIIDEAHLVTPTVKEIIEKISAKNPMLRVIGMTATPYRMGTGYIYQYDATAPKTRKLSEDETISAYFHSLLYKIHTRELIEMGFLTEAHTDTTVIHGYDANGLELNKLGQFDAKEIERVFVGQGRLTSQIVADVVSHSAGRKGVMLFAATVRHAQEIMGSLPPNNSMMLGGEVNMGKHEREKLIDDFKNQRFKYIVSVGTLTTGFDAPHVDVIAILRATESASLFQQIIGRGLRLCEGKDDCLVLDYAENIERHELKNDIFTPTIKTSKSKGSGTIEVPCPYCQFDNEFALRPNPDELRIDREGYFIDLAGNRFLLDSPDGETRFFAAHLGRRCNGAVKSMLNKGKLDRCEHRWACKTCKDCDHENDIAARYCERCKAELVDPNDSLKAEFDKVKRDPSVYVTERVLFFSARKGKSKAGNDMLICEYSTASDNFRAFYTVNPDNKMIMKKWKDLNVALYGHVGYRTSIDAFMETYVNEMPETVTYRKNPSTGYYDILCYNAEITE
jgi:DNA repair protein RadD